MTKHWTALVAASLLALVALATVASADIFEWEYINPADPALGKQQSTMLVPDGAGANVERGENLAHRNLTMAYLIGADLGAVFPDDFPINGSNLTGANLSQADLSDASLYGANLTNVNFTQATLANVNFIYATLTGADLSLANLTNAYLFGATLTGANLTGAEVRGATFSSITAAQLYTTASYQAHDLTGIFWANIDLAEADLASQNLMNAHFYYTNLTHSDLTGADARGANFQGSTMTGAITSNLIQANGHIAGLDLTAGASLVVRDYDGNPAASPPTSPLPIVVDQHLAMDATGALRLVFDADPWDSTISFAPGIPVALGGTLELAFSPGVDVATQSGRTIDLFDWTGVAPTGAFTVESPYVWNLSRLYTTGEVTLAAAPSLAGDYNLDGTVDAGDYTVWRNNLGDPDEWDLNNNGDGGGVGPSDYTWWKQHYGNSNLGPGGGGLTQSTVPEPTTLMMLSVIALALLPRRRPATS